MLKLVIHKLRQSQAGFTLVEILVGISLALLVSGLLFTALFSQYITVLVEAERANLRSSGQSLLVSLQDELLFTIYFGEEINEDLTDPNAPSGGWTHDTTPSTLLINEVALDSVRNDVDRNIVRKEVNDCETSPITSNPVAVNNIIYFVEENENNDFMTLYKRTITPDYALCGIDEVTENPCTPTTTTCKGNIKQQSCPAEEIGNDGCLVEDSVLTENVSDFSVTYYTVDNVETIYPSSAEKIQVSLTLSDVVYGRDVDAVVNHTIRKIN